ncbi:MAG: long-chain acyl-CoA synthetase [Fibrobacteres bacterium]|nr:long-chain acyl-CoA synthetase [Fibrobacterota bacterium]
MIETIRTEWKRAQADLLSGEFFRRMQDGTLTLEHYKIWLRETYYNTRENPTSFALMAGHLKGGQRDISKRIFRHCAAEYGHHELALADLGALGVDVSGLPDGRPLATTEALIAFAIYHIHQGKPASYLGYVFHLEMLASGKGEHLIKSLAGIGVPENAMSFLTEHAEADVGHTKWLEQNFREAIATEEDLEAVIHVATGSCKLYGIMLQGIMDEAAGKHDWRPADLVTTKAKVRAS